MPLLIFVVLAVGNHFALKLTVAELQIVRGIAVTKTRYNFVGTQPTQMLRFHLLLVVMVAGMYLVASYVVMP